MLIYADFQKMKDFWGLLGNFYEKWKGPIYKGKWQKVEFLCKGLYLHGSLDLDGAEFRGLFLSLISKGISKNGSIIIRTSSKDVLFLLLPICNPIFCDVLFCSDHQFSLKELVSRNFSFKWMVGCVKNSKSWSSTIFFFVLF